MARASRGISMLAQRLSKKSNSSTCPVLAAVCSFTWPAFTRPISARASDGRSHELLFVGCI